MTHENARALALDLSELSASEREALLSELPPDRRAEIDGLITEIERLEREPAHSFERHWIAASEPLPMASEHSLSIEPLLRLNEGQLRLLLANEPPAIQRRVSALLRSSALTQLPSSLRQALAEHLMQLWSASALPSKDLIKERGGWWETLRSRFS